MAEKAELKKLDARKKNEYDQESFERERYQFNQAQQRFEWERCHIAEEKRLKWEWQQLQEENCCMARKSAGRNIHTIRPLFWPSVELRHLPVLKIQACKM